MIKKLKKILPELLWIVALSSILGIIHNVSSDKPLNIIPKPIDTVSTQDILNIDSLKNQPAYFDKTVTYDQVVKFLNDPKIVYIDARTPEQYEAGHIGNSINIYPYMEDQQAYLEKVNNLPSDKIIFVYCDGGSCDLSHELAKTLFEFGYKQCFIYLGGWEEWGKKQKLSQ